MLQPPTNKPDPRVVAARLKRLSHGLRAMSYLFYGAAWGNLYMCYRALTNPTIPGPVGAMVAIIGGIFYWVGFKYGDFADETRNKAKEIEEKNNGKSN